MAIKASAVFGSFRDSFASRTLPPDEDFTPNIIQHFEQDGRKFTSAMNNKEKAEQGDR